MSLWIKICGNTTLEDAQLAAGAGANALGFVFAPSRRRVTVEQAAAIIPHLPAATEKIGVFVDANLDEIASTVDSCGLTGVQLHFDAPPALAARLRERFGAKLRILRVVHFDAKESPKAVGSVSGHDFSRAAIEGRNLGALAPEGCFSDPNFDAILVDSQTAAAVGGTGQVYDWVAASKILFQNAKARKPLIAAGGLTPENVAEAIGTLHPWGVDVVTGVEAAPGKKNPARVLAFIANARSAV
jgi:phosphoribosylanthranilate isomerase